MSSLPIHYISYDRFPAPKGAAVHIDAFVRGLASAFGAVRLTTVADVAALSTSVSEVYSPVASEYCSGVLHTALQVHGKNLIQRVTSFRRQMFSTWPSQRPGVVHFRSIFEGYPIARDKKSLCHKIVYEVNGLPSIELKYHYPQVADDREFVNKLRHQERTCLNAADLIVTVSDVNAENLMRRGVDERKLRVIPNGVDTERFTFQSPVQTSPEMRMLYVGTLATWQGIRVAIEALALYCRDHPATLKIIGDGRRRQRDELLRLAERLRVHDKIEILPPQPQNDLVQHYHASDVVVAPLQANDRNLVQGCCPLKVLEAMASGTPLIASDLPVTQPLACDGIDALLVRAGSAKAIKDAMLRLRESPRLAIQLSASARRRVKQHFTWQRAQEQLVSAYEEVLGMRRASSDDNSVASLSG